MTTFIFNYIIWTAFCFWLGSVTKPKDHNAKHQYIFITIYVIISYLMYVFFGDAVKEHSTYITSGAMWVLDDVITLTSYFGGVLYSIHKHKTAT